MAGLDKILEGAAELAGGALRKTSVLSGNAAINPIEGLGKLAGANAKPFAERGIHGAVRGMRNGEGFQNSVKKAFTKADDSTLAWGTIAGSYIGASAGYRALSGGGVYRDKNGNTNLIGVPFV